MPVLSYNQITLKKVIIQDGEPYLVIASHVFRKQQRKPVNITKLKNLKSGRVVEITFHQNETANEADLETRTVTFIFKKPGEYWFHNENKPAERFFLTEELVGDQGKFLKERSDIDVLVFDEEVIERVREGGEVEIRRTTRRNRRIHDELPLVAEKYKEFRATGEVTL